VALLTALKSIPATLRQSLEFAPIATFRGYPVQIDGDEHRDELRACSFRSAKLGGWQVAC
jgi:hypothetical protein